MISYLVSSIEKKGFWELGNLERKFFFRPGRAKAGRMQRILWIGRRNPGLGGLVVEGSLAKVRGISKEKPFLFSIPDPQDVRKSLIVGEKPPPLRLVVPTAGMGTGLLGECLDG